MITNQLFTELFRGKTLDNVVLLPRIKNEISKGLTQNYIFYSTSGGTGKSTCARILTQDYDTLSLNGSISGIDSVRESIINFCSSLSLDNGLEKMKAVYIDEADALTIAAFDALREVIERFAKSTRFIFTCNKINKIPGPILSRFNCIPFQAITKEEDEQLFEGYVNYVSAVLDTVKITYQRDTVTTFVRGFYPDMRSILNAIQALYTQNIHELTVESLQKSFDYSDLFQQLIDCHAPSDNYKFIMERYGGNPDDALLGISENFTEFLRTSYPQYENKIPYIIICIAEYVNMLASSPDHIIVLLACCFKIQTILNTVNNE